MIAAIALIASVCLIISFQTLNKTRAFEVTTAVDEPKNKNFEKVDKVEEVDVNDEILVMEGPAPADDVEYATVNEVVKTIEAEANIVATLDKSSCAITAGFAGLDNGGDYVPLEEIVETSVVIEEKLAKGDIDNTKSSRGLEQPNPLKECDNCIIKQ